MDRQLRLKRARFEIWCAEVLGHNIDFDRGIMLMQRGEVYDVFDLGKYITTISCYTANVITATMKNLK